MRKAKLVYAVIRIDLFNFETVERLESIITVKEVVPTLDRAQKEVERLMALNGGKNVRYFWQQTRSIDEPPGDDG